MSECLGLSNLYVFHILVWICDQSVKHVHLTVAGCHAALLIHDSMSLIEYILVEFISLGE